MVAMAAKYSTKVEDDTMLEFKFDTQLLIEGKNLSEDAINDYITQNIELSLIHIYWQPLLTWTRFPPFPPARI